MTKMYIDIESTGLSSVHNDVTIIGVLSEDNFIQYVDGIDLEEYVINDFIVDNDVTEIIGYNNINFDVPFIVENNFLSQEVVNRMQLTDLMNTAHGLGIKGGLKATEIKLGIIRKAEPLNFYQQIALWKRWQEIADKKALNKYLFYNTEDVMNLPIVEQKLVELKEKKAQEHEKFIRIYKQRKGLV